MKNDTITGQLVTASPRRAIQRRVACLALLIAIASAGSGCTLSVANGILEYSNPQFRGVAFNRTNQFTVETKEGKHQRSTTVGVDTGGQPDK